METHTIDEYLKLNDLYIQKSVRIENIVGYIEIAINRLWNARIMYNQDTHFSDYLYNSNECIIKEMALQRWILRYQQEIKR
jgi:hypothetical protein